MVEERINSNLMCNIYRQQVEALREENDKLKALIKEAKQYIPQSKIVGMIDELLESK